MPVGNKDAKSQGFDFISNNRYLQDNFTGSTPLDFSNISSSGIMSQAPVATAPLQYVPEGGGGDDDNNGPGPTGPDLGVDANDFGSGVVGNMGMTEEEQAGVDSIKNAKMGKMGLAKTALSFLSNPFLGIYRAFKENKKAKQDAIDKARAAQQQRDFDAAKANQNQGIASQLGGEGGTSGGNYTGGAGFASANAYGGDGTMDDLGADGFEAKDGGRIGYFFGGRVNYKVGGRVSFKNGGLASIL